MRAAKIHWQGAAVLCFSSLLAGCGNSNSGSAGGVKIVKSGEKTFHIAPEGTPLKLAFICNNASDFWNIARKGVQKAEAEFKIRVDFLTPPDPPQAATQNQYLENLLTQGYHGAAISPISADAQKREIDLASVKMNMITQDSDVPQSKRLAYVGTNNLEAGKALGEQIVKLLPKGGKVAVFVGTFSADNASQRLRGIEEAIEGKNISIVAKKEDNKDFAKAKANAEDVLNTIPDVSVLAGLWAYDPPLLASALTSTKKEGKVFCVGFDEDDATLSAVENGVIQCTVVQKPFEFGYQSIKLLRELSYKGEAAVPKNSHLDTGIEIITKENVKEFRGKLAEMKK